MQNFKSKLKNKKRNLFIVLIIIIIVLIILLSRCGAGQKQKTNNTNIKINNLNANFNTNANTNQENLWPDLSGCIVDLIIDYHSNSKVKNEVDAAKVFKDYVAWAQANHKEIFSQKGNDWQFQSAKPHGTYKNIKYWQITALWFSETKQQWLPQIVFDVGENGQVVRLLGCL